MKRKRGGRGIPLKPMRSGFSDPRLTRRGGGELCSIAVRSEVVTVEPTPTSTRRQAQGKRAQELILARFITADSYRELLAEINLDGKRQWMFTPTDADNFGFVPVRTGGLAVESADGLTDLVNDINNRCPLLATRVSGCKRLGRRRALGVLLTPDDKHADDPGLPLDSSYAPLGILSKTGAEKISKLPRILEGTQVILGQAAVIAASDMWQA